MARWTSSADGRPPFGGPWVRASIVLELVTPFVERFGVSEGCERAAINPRVFYDLRTGRARWAAFETVDRVIQQGLGRPDLWRTDPRLARVYRQVA